MGASELQPGVSGFRFIQWIAPVVSIALRHFWEILCPVQK
jgi:hypothetical protein